MCVSHHTKLSKQVGISNFDLFVLIDQNNFLQQQKQFNHTWVGRRVVCRRHVRQGSAASSGPGSGLGGTRGQHTRENLFHWPDGKTGVSQTSTSSNTQ